MLLKITKTKNIIAKEKCNNKKKNIMEENGERYDFVEYAVVSWN